MADKRASLALTALLVCALTACGQKGPLYLPEAPTEMVTRPAATPPPPADTSAPNSPQTPDSPSAPPSPAPEVTAPEVTAPEGTPPADKDKKAATPPPPK